MATVGGVQRQAPYGRIPVDSLLSRGGNPVDAKMLKGVDVGAQMSAMTELSGLDVLCAAAEAHSVAPVMQATAAAGLPSPKKRVKPATKSWTPEEDDELKQLVRKHGTSSWPEISKHLSGRNARQAKERWTNHVHPNVSKRSWTPHEDQVILDAHRKYGNKWTMIAKQLKGRSDNAVKNRFNSALKPRLLREQQDGRPLTAPAPPKPQAPPVGPPKPSSKV
mmetsp:Transcript_12273/g.37445  ORF Transcript_12273/g.37445 Transcript_12273/m.37445 type:complete len:221 (-) Transcript_12273:79-741(-)